MSTSTIRVLVVGDDAYRLEYCRLSLALQGFWVCATKSAEDGLKLAVDTAPDVILLDLAIGGPSGIELLRHLVNEGLARKLVVFAGSANPEWRLWAKRLGVAAYVDKPVFRDEFAELLRRVAERPAAEERIPTQTGGDVGSGGFVGNVDAQAPRAARIARLLVGFLSATADAHSVGDLCRIGPVGVAPSTFRTWCRAERVRPSRVLGFARLLRALMLARTHGTSVLEWMDIDPRTFRALLRRAEAHELFNGRVPTTWEFIDGQRLISNPVLLKAIRSCPDCEPEAAVMERRTPAVSRFWTRIWGAFCLA